MVPAIVGLLLTLITLILTSPIYPTVLIGSKRASKLLEKVGKNMGESIINEIESKHDVKEWSSEAFKEFFIKGYLEEAGAEPAIPGRTEGQTG